MNRKLLLVGGAAAVGLVLLSRSKASAATPPALPGPMPKLVPTQPPARAVETVPRKVSIIATPDDQAAANAAAAAVASAQSPTMTLPVSSPAASSLTSTSSPSAPQPGESPSLSQTPDGYDPAAARKAAKGVSNHLANKGIAGYSRPLLKQWQRQAGLAPDGTYGGATRGALIYYGVASPPRAMFKPTETIPYRPPA